MDANDISTIFDVIRSKDELFIEQQLASRKYDLNAVDIRGYSPILLAAIDGNQQLIELLIKQGAAFSDDCRPKDVHCDPLHIAAKRGHLNVVKLLVDKGANVNAIDTVGRTPLWYTLLSGHVDVFLFLLENGAKANLIPECVANAAVKSMSIELISKVLSLGFKLSSFDEGTALHHIIWRDMIECCYPGYSSRNFLEVFRFLLSKRSVDIDEKFASKGTPLTYAFTMRRHNFTYELIKHGANVRECSLQRFHFSSDSIPSLKCLLYSGFRFDVNFFRENCIPLTPKDRNLKRQLEVTCCKPCCGWLTDEEYKHELSAFREFCEWLESQTLTPFSLKALCRIVIRMRFGTFINDYIESTMLPESVKNFILFRC
ncbi:hypothetical protein B4U79_03359 [Dinothrombium tinctorium]|uniref:Alpha-latrotoxin n=1 Tax=Dinothrombium tinctorium TaxID=1965070 RepID=A0A3S3PH62_9ACAR|nr:hypothetical protein B4U79_02730 [Dinothrombium tinctorium]RWS12344.1 hypothetical protein B4U79_09163 [Dinothrombium tinctorium]RWS12345.1 hypothetical protein B4U79_03359 [Dinothrombium tinctorium]